MSVPLVGWGALATLWDILVALWHARGLLAAVVLAGMAFAWLCKRHPYVAIFVLGFVRGLFGRR